MKSLSLGRLLTAVALFMASGVVHAQTPEMRAVWVDAWGAGALNAAQITTLVNHCRTYNFNAVVVQVRRRGDAFYMPQAPNGDPRTTVVAADFDVLQELINQCHTGTPRIEVHTWVTTQLIWSAQGTPPSQPGHVYNLHPEYLMQNSSGATFIGEGYYLDPGHPDAGTWNYNMARDVCSRYNIDGFHWDYIRYPQGDSGYNPTAVARYNAEYGLSGQPSSSDAQWSNWRRRQVTDFLRWSSSELLAIKPQLIISASVFGSRSDAYNARFQDWGAWNTEGLLDICFPMNYSSSNSTFNSRVDDAFLNQGVRRVYMGLGCYLNSKENTVVQLNYSRNKPLLGTNFYSYRTPNSGTVDQTGTFTYVRDNYQPTWVNTPTLPWKSNPTKGIIKGTVTRSDNGLPIYNATVTLQTPAPRNQRSEAHGKYAFFETAPGTYTVEASAAGMGTGTGTANVVAGQVVNVNLVVSATDTTPPNISGVASGSISDTGATITWTTNEAGSSVVEYGTSTGYGSTASNPAMVLSHTVNLTGLAANTLYHFRVKSLDAAGNPGVSGDFTFTTLAAGQVADIIIDNPQATIAGSWVLATFSTDKYDTDYRYKSQGSGAAYLTYTPNIITAGSYNVYAWHPQGPNRTVAAPHVITHSGGSATVNINQQTGGGAWNLLGNYTFPAGTTKYVRITDGFPDGGMVVMADAVKFVYVPPTPPAPPAAPSDLAATPASSSRINLTWTDNATNESNYIIARSTTPGGPYTDIATIGANTTSYGNTNLPSLTTYYYVVRAWNAGGSSANSNQASATTLAVAGTPVAPSTLSGTAVSSSTIKLRWVDNSTNETRFVIEYKTADASDWSEKKVGANITATSLTGLVSNTTYNIRLKATNAFGSSSYSNTINVTTLSGKSLSGAGTGTTVKPAPLKGGKRMTNATFELQTARFRANRGGARGSR